MENEKRGERERFGTKRDGRHCYHFVVIRRAISSTLSHLIKMATRFVVLSRTSQEEVEVRSSASSQRSDMEWLMVGDAIDDEKRNIKTDSMKDVARSNGEDVLRPNAKMLALKSFQQRDRAAGSEGKGKKLAPGKWTPGEMEKQSEDAVTAVPEKPKRRVPAPPTWEPEDEFLPERVSHITASTASGGKVVTRMNLFPYMGEPGQGSEDKELALQHRRLALAGMMVEKVEVSGVPPAYHKVLETCSYSQEHQAEVISAASTDDMEPSELEKEMGVHKYPYGWTIGGVLGYAHIEYTDAIVQEALFNELKEITVKKLGPDAVFQEGAKDMFFVQFSGGSITVGAVIEKSKAKTTLMKTAGPRWYIRGLAKKNMHSKPISRMMRAIRRRLHGVRPAVAPSPLR